MEWLSLSCGVTEGVKARDVTDFRWQREAASRTCWSCNAMQCHCGAQEGCKKRASCHLCSGAEPLAWACKQVITAAEFHPSSCHVFAYSSSKGSVRLADQRASALCEHHAKAFTLSDQGVSHARTLACKYMCMIRQF